MYRWNSMYLKHFFYEHQQEMCHSGSENKTLTHSALFALLKHDVTRTCAEHNKKS
jgi:hypothetical protein